MKLVKKKPSKSMSESKNDVPPPTQHEAKDEDKVGDVTKIPRVCTTVEFWDAWLKKSVPHRSKDGSGVLEAKSNTRWVMESAFCGYLAAKKQSVTHLFLLATSLQEGVHLAAGSKLDLAPIAFHPAVQRYIDAPYDPAYYLLLFRKDDVLLVFRKRINSAPYAAATLDTESVLAFYRDIGDRGPLPTNHILSDDA